MHVNATNVNIFAANASILNLMMVRIDGGVKSFEVDATPLPLATVLVLNFFDRAAKNHASYPYLLVMFL